jgi:quinol monooxygenase YgiN
MHALLNRLTTNPGQRDRVIEILLESGKPFDRNPDCLLYLVVESTEDPNLIWVVDLWSSEQGHTDALNAPELQRYIQECLPLLQGTPEQIKVRPAGGKLPTE